LKENNTSCLNLQFFNFSHKNDSMYDICYSATLFSSSPSVQDILAFLENTPSQDVHLGSACTPWWLP
jgi:hypothetical protein